MAKQIKRRRGNTAQHQNFVGAPGEITVDTDKKTLVVHDGVTQGGFPLLRKDISNYSGANVGNLNISSINNGPLGGFRNYFDNGNFQIWQRGTSFSNTISRFFADRWGLWAVAGITGTGIHVSKATHTFTEAEYGGEQVNSFQITVSSPQPTNTGYTLSQQIYPVHTLEDRTVTLSFWIKCDKLPTQPGSVGITHYYGSNVIGVNGVATESFELGNYTINSVNTFERKVITVHLPKVDPTKTVGLNSFLDIGIRIPLASVTTPAVFNITGIQLEEGPVATIFENRPVSSELTQCQRYYAKSYSGEVAPATITTIGRHTSRILSGTHLYHTTIQLPEPMRVPPAISIYSPTTGNFGVGVHNQSGTQYPIVPYHISENSFSVYMPTNQLPVGDGLQDFSFHWVVESAITI